MTSDRIEEIIKGTAYPQSNSVLQALHQVWNEVQQECNKSKGSCKECIHVCYPKAKTYEGHPKCMKNNSCGEVAITINGNYYEHQIINPNWFCADF